MGFSQKIKEEELVASARHCCVCHRYAGVNVEIHHLVPKGKGGNDLRENAIALCYDCHAFAGHYNPDHPKGTKYSPSELRKAKVNWHELVKANKITAEQIDTKVLTRYIICKDHSLIKDIFDGSFDKTPLTSVLLLQSKQLQLISEILKMSSGISVPFKKEYKSVEEYRMANPGAKEIRSAGVFQFRKTPKNKDFHKHFDKLDNLSKYLLELGVPVDRYASAEATYTNSFECGSEYETVSELYCIKPLWAVFLSIENLTDGLINLNEFESELSTNAEFVSSFNDRQLLASTQKLPQTSLKSGESVLVPLGLVFGEIHNQQYQSVLMGQKKQHVECVVDYSLDEGLSVSNYHIGRFEFPKNFTYKIGSQNITQRIHSLDFSRTYVLDRHWLIGCCPHLFAIVGAEIKYLGELFTKQYPEVEIRTIIPPDNARSLIVAELEEELTNLYFVATNAKVITVDKKLRKGDFLEIPVVGISSLVCCGNYELKVNPTMENSRKIFEKHRILREFMTFALET